MENMSEFACLMQYWDATVRFSDVSQGQKKFKMSRSPIVTTKMIGRVDDNVGH